MVMMKEGGESLYRRAGARGEQLGFSLVYLVLVVCGCSGLLTYTTLSFYPGPYNYNVLPISPIFELLFLLCAAAAFLTWPLQKGEGASKGAIAFFILFLVYLCVTSSISIFDSPASVKDYLVGYKGFIYSLLLAPMIGRKIFTLPGLKRLFLFMLAIFLVKYGYSRVLDLDARMGSRPGVYMENNFELVFLLLLFYLVIDYIKFPLWTFAALILAVYLSDSRSGMLCLFAVYFCSAVRTWRSIRFRWLWMCPLLFILILSVLMGRMGLSPSVVAYSVYQKASHEVTSWLPSNTVQTGSSDEQQQPLSGVKEHAADSSEHRLETIPSKSAGSANNEAVGTPGQQPVAGDAASVRKEEGDNSYQESTEAETPRQVERNINSQLNSVDRIKFLHMFMQSTEHWHWWNYLAGTKPMTPLSPESCQALSYWKTLFSYENDGLCYSVILHSYLLRGIYDHGLLGLFFLNFFLAYGLWKSGYRKIDILCVIGVMMLSSLSVSAYNSFFYALAMAVYFVTPGGRRTKAAT